MMRFALLAALLVQEKADCKLEMRKFEAYTVTFTDETSVESSDGRNSAWKLTLAIRYESEKMESGVMHLDGFIQSIKAKGTWRGAEFSFESAKGGAVKATGARLPATLTTACEKGFKLKVTERGEVSIVSGLSELVEVFPIWSPHALVGLPCPFDEKAQNVWKSKGHKFETCGAFETEIQGAVGEMKDGLVTISTHFKHKPSEGEAPIEGSMTVKGEGDAKATFNMKEKKPVKGDFTAVVHVAQGGFKRDYTQKVSFEVTK